MSKPALGIASGNFDFPKLIEFVMRRHGKAIQESGLSGEELDALSRRHLDKRCGGDCLFCTIDRDAESYTILTCLGVRVEE